MAKPSAAIITAFGIAMLALLASVYDFPGSLENFSINFLDSLGFTGTAHGTSPSLANINTTLAPILFVFEAYSLHGVRKVDLFTTAFAHREDALLMAPVVIWDASTLKSGQAEKAERTALKFGKEMREALVKGDGGDLRAYVNYAHGDESLEAMYGCEEWRLEELRRLKREWDPRGRFGWYAPIE